MTAQIRSRLSPTTHERPSNTPTLGSSTARLFSRRKQRRKLWLSGLGRLLITLLLCIITFAILWSYGHREYLLANDLGLFNALMIAFPLAIAFNLTASLSNYANLLKWRILASAYRPLDQFFLLMKCADPASVAKLVFAGSRTKHWIWPITTRILAALWLLLNLGAAVAVALIGLTFPTVASTAYILQTGTLSVANLGLLTVDTVQSYGITGYGFTVANAGGPETDPRTIWDDCAGLVDCHGKMHYRFQDQNADAPTNFMATSRTVSADATCQLYNVVSGSWGNESSVTYEKDGQIITQDIAGQGCVGGMTYIYYIQSAQDCGARCAVVKAFQAQAMAAGNYNPFGAFYECTVTLSIITSASDSDARTPISPIRPETSLPDDIARQHRPQRPAPYTQLYALYPQYSLFNFLGAVIPEDVADKLAQFSLGSIAALDYSGSPARLNLTSQPVPTIPLRVDVAWPYAGALLALLPVLQLLTFLLVVTWANKAIIRDDDPLSTGRLLQPLLMKLGAGGCLLNDDEMIDTLQNPRVAYNFDGSAHVTDGALWVGIVEKSQGLTIENIFEDGEYD